MLKNHYNSCILTVIGYHSETLIKQAILGRPGKQLRCETLVGPLLQSGAGGTAEHPGAALMFLFFGSLFGGKRFFAHVSGAGALKQHARALWQRLRASREPMEYVQNAVELGEKIAENG